MSLHVKVKEFLWGRGVKLRHHYVRDATPVPSDTWASSPILHKAEPFSKRVAPMYTAACHEIICLLPTPAIFRLLQFVSLLGGHGLNHVPLVTNEKLFLCFFFCEVPAKVFCPLLSLLLSLSFFLFSSSSPFPSSFLNFHRASIFFKKLLQDIINQFLDLPVLFLFEMCPLSSQTLTCLENMMWHQPNHIWKTSWTVQAVFPDHVPCFCFGK